REHALPLAEPGDVLADPDDLSRGLMSHDVRRLRRLRVESLAREDVREVDAGGPDLDQDVVRPDLGVRAVLEDQALGWTGLPKVDRAHRSVRRRHRDRALSV